jgi:hypothetical protein
MLGHPANLAASRCGSTEKTSSGDRQEFAFCAPARTECCAGEEGRVFELTKHGAIVSRLVAICQFTSVVDKREPPREQNRVGATHLSTKRSQVG